jgi:siroheme synthase-like protein
MKTYPINLVLQNQLVLLIGGKGEITRKIPGLLDVGAHIRVIAPHVDPSVEAYANAGQIEWLARPYQPGDLQGAAVIFAMTHNQPVHDQIWAEGQANNQLVNVMDVIPQCNFHGASIVRQGLLTIAIGTGGAAPTLAVTLRKRFEKEFGPEYAEFLDYAQALRPTVARRIPAKDRARFWYTLLDTDPFELIRRGEYERFDAHVQTLITQFEAQPEAV